MSFKQAFDATVGLEGKYSNNPNDSGGETMYGITAKVARANGYTGQMRDMPLDTACSIYRRQYWDLLQLNTIDLSSESIAYEMFDTAVNCGVGVAGRILQQALNVFNRGQRDYPDVPVDGIIGPVTISCLRMYLTVRGDDGLTVLLRTLNCLQAARYVDLAETSPKNEDFVYGWIRNRVSA